MPLALCAPTMEEETDVYGMMNLNSPEESSDMYYADGEDTSVNVTVWPPVDDDEEDENRILAKLFEGFYQETNGDEDDDSVIHVENPDDIGDDDDDEDRIIKGKPARNGQLEMKARLSSTTSDGKSFR